MTEMETLTGGEVLPSFICPISQILAWFKNP